MKRNYKYTLSLLPGLIVVAGNMAGGWWVFSNFVFSIGILALLERFVAEDKDNVADENDWFPDGLLYAHVLLQTIALASALWGISHHNLTWPQIFGIALSTGINSGSSAIVIAHELIHRKNRLQRAMGQYLLFSAGNIYFFIDHLKVHHKWVGTEHDPASSRYGESLYAFFLRSTVGQIRSAFRVEASRLAEEGRSAWTVGNYVIASGFLMLLLLLVLFAFLGWLAVVFFISQTVVANFLLEYTNYIEHYGLSRPDHERVTEIHSWQTDKVISRYFLIDLSRHADHHYYASRPYHTLRSYETSPVLPGGYVSMIYYALLPPVFFKKMHPLMEQLYPGRFQKSS